jgi:hypothetical protein
MTWLIVKMVYGPVKGKGKVVPAVAIRAYEAVEVQRH